MRVACYIPIEKWMKDMNVIVVETVDDDIWQQSNQVPLLNKNRDIIWSPATLYKIEERTFWSLLGAPWLLDVYVPLRLDALLHVSQFV